MGSSGPGATLPLGRRPGASTTRQDVLDAARGQFAAHGFDATTIRGVALEAGVDAALVMRLFRSKSELFAAVMSVPAHVLSQLDAAFDGPDEHHGDRLVGAFLDLWEGTPQEAEPLLAMLRGALVNDLAREQLREFIQARLVGGVRSRAGDPAGAALRAGVVASMLVGLVLARDVIEVPTLAAAERADLVRLVGPAVQVVLHAEAPETIAHPVQHSVGGE